MHFCVFAARLYGRVPMPRNTSLNWFMPALVNSSVGSSCGTSGELGTMRCPLRSKYLRKDARISFDVIGRILLLPRPLPNQTGGSGGREALAHEIAQELASLAGLLQLVSVAAEASVQRLLEALAFIGLAEQIPGD